MGHLETLVLFTLRYQLQLSNSKYIVISDYEIMFSYGFESDMRELAEKHLTANPKTVLVCRIFEALGGMST